jgi:hypothetical protein
VLGMCMCVTYASFLHFFIASCCCSTMGSFLLRWPHKYVLIIWKWTMHKIDFMERQEVVSNAKEKRKTL